MRPQLWLCLVLPLAPLASAAAQTISVKTIPIAQAEQFQLFPSRNAGMGGVGIALHDTIADVGANPAKGARLREMRFFSSPSLYKVKDGSDLGRTIPMGAVRGSGRWFGSFSAALQGLEGAGSGAAPQVTLDARGVTVPTDNGSRANQFGFVSFGRAVGTDGLSVGASAFWAGIHAIDGVDRLYAGSQSVRQHGHALDMRIGALKEWASSASLEAVLLHSRFATTHDVTFSEVFFNPSLATNQTRARLETNLDYTNTWGLHMAYERPISAQGARAGAVFTVNRMSHPKIPEYRLVQVNTIPWDPGHTNAFNLGFGVSKVDGPARFAADVVLEPIWTHTWGETPVPLTDRMGQVIPEGGRTVENWFRFLNASARLGAERSFLNLDNAITFQAGLHVDAVSYHFWQTDHVQVAGREQNVGWSSITPTWGLRVHFSEFDLSYQGRAVTGLGRPGCGCGGDFAIADRAQSASDAGGIASGSIVSPPSAGGVTMGDATLFTHQLSITVPLWRMRASKVVP